MKKYEDLIRERYCNDACVEAFRKLAGSPKDPVLTGHAIEAALPVLGVVLSMHFRRLKPGGEEYDEILSSIPSRLYYHITKDQFYRRYYDGSDSQFSYLFTFFYFEILNVLKRCRRQATLYHDVPRTTFLAFNFEAAPASTEYKVLVSELPRRIQETATERIRFSGDDHDVCAFLVESLVAGKGVPTVILRQRWGVRDPGFLVDYTRVLIRSVLLEMKPIIDRIPTVEDTNQEGALIRSLYEVFTEGLHAGPDHEFWFGVDNTDGSLQQWGGPLVDRGPDVLETVDVGHAQGG